MDGALPIQQPEGHKHHDATVDQVGKPIVSAEVSINMQNPSGHRITVVSTASLEPRLKDFSFKGYTRLEEHYHLKSDPTISSEVMYLPTKGFTVGYEIPELGLRETYDNQSGDAVPDWLELENDVEGLYTTATIKAHPNLDRMQNYDLSLYTLAQRSYDPDEVMQRDLTCNVTFSPISAEGNMVYRVNGQNVTGDLTFDNSAAVDNITNMLKADGFISKDDAAVFEDVFNQTKAYFTVYDNVFEGAEVTLTREGDDEPLQTLTNYKGCFMFMPPADGRTYIIDVYYPAFDKHYKSTFVSHRLLGIRAVALKMFKRNASDSGNYIFTFTNDEKEYAIPFDTELKGYIYADGADEFYLSKEGEQLKPRFDFPEEFHAVIYNNTPELKNDATLYSLREAENGYADWKCLNRLKNTYENPTAQWRERTVMLDWESIAQNYTLVTVLNSWGAPVKNVTLNYACVDKDMANPTSIGTATYSAELDGYLIQTDPGQYAELIEVVQPGHNHPELEKMNLWDYDYSSTENRGKERRFTIVANDKRDDMVSNCYLQTLELTNGYSRLAGNTYAKIKSTRLDGGYRNVKYSETDDYPTVYKFIKDRGSIYEERYAKNFAHVSVSVHADDIQSRKSFFFAALTK